MFVHKYIYMHKITLHLLKHTPDKLFNYNTYFKSKYNVSNISIYYKYKSKQGLIVTLRAPKHFKVGRQQYNTYNNLVYIVVRFNSIQGIYNITCNDISKVIVTTSNTLQNSTPYTFISDQSCVKFTYTITTKINIV